MNARKVLAIAGMLTFTFTGAARAAEMAETPVLVESLKLEAAVFSQTYYRRGDEIVLQLDVDPRTAAVNADFSAVDSRFRPAALRIEVTGHTERVIRYKLSQGNTRKAGTYRVAVHLEPAAGGATVTRKLPVEYLPGGPGEIVVPTGNFVAGRMPRRERQREMSVVAALRQDGRAPLKNRIDPTKPVELALVLSSPRRLSPNSLKLELAEPRADAFWRVSIRLTAERCTRVGCQYQALTSLDLGPGGGDGNRTPALAGQLVTSGGAAVPFDLPGLGKTSRPSPRTHRVSGTLNFQYQDRQPDPSPMYGTHPWKAPVLETTLQRPIRYASVRLEDECGHDITSTTTATGAFLFEWTPVNCGIGTVTVSAFSASQKAAVAYWLNEPINSPGELTGDANDYRAHTWSFGFDTATAAIAAGGRNLGAIAIGKSATAARAFYILDNVMIARAYYDSLPGISMYFEAPTIGVVYSPGLKPDDKSCNLDWDPSGYLITAFYSPGKHEGFIYIPAEPEAGCDFGWDAHAITHETSHLFQRHFLRGEDIDYGRFGEGMANVQAAVIRGTKWITGAAQDQLEDIDVNSRMACWKNGVLLTDEDDKIDGPNSRQACLDDGGSVGFPLPVLFDDSTASAGWFQRVVWDLVDESDDLASEPVTTLVPEGLTPEDCGGGACSTGSFDLVNGGGGDGEVLPSSAALNDVLIYYLGGSKALGTNPNYQDRGLGGLDLVDLFDGMVCRGHATVEEIQTLYGIMGFTYDGLGPATCPHPMD